MISDSEKFARFYKSNLGKEILRAEVNYLKKELKDRKRILDIGCGIGVFEEVMPELNIVGLDNSEAMLGEARKRSDKKFVLGDAQDLDFANQSFDAIFMVTTLEFLENYQRAVKEAARVLAPKGKLVIMMLNPESEYFKSHASKENSYFRRIRHTNSRDIKNYISKFFDAGEEYFLEIKNQEVFATNKKSSALYVVKGIKK